MKELERSWHSKQKGEVSNSQNIKRSKEVIQYPPRKYTHVSRTEGVHTVKWKMGEKYASGVVHTCYHRRVWYSRRIVNTKQDAMDRRAYDIRFESV